MNLLEILSLDKSIARNAKCCYNLVFAGGGYALAVVALSLIAIIFSEVMVRLALIVGLDERARSSSPKLALPYSGS